MGRITNAIITISAIGGIYIAFQPQIKAAWASIQSGLIFPTGTQLLCKITASPQNGPSPLTVDFAANASGGNQPYKYEWDFGDGASSTLPSPSHVYSGVSTVIAKVVVTDARGETSTDFITIGVGSVTTPAPNPNPPTTSTPPLSITSFTASPSPAPNGSPIAFSVITTGGSGNLSGSIDFGDGNTAVMEEQPLNSSNSNQFLNDHSYSLQLQQTITKSVIATITDNVTGQKVSKTLSLPILPELATGTGPTLPNVAVSKIIISSNIGGGFWGVTLVYTDGTSKSYSLSTTNVIYWIDQGATLIDNSHSWTGPTQPSGVNPPPSNPGTLNLAVSPGVIGNSNNSATADVNIFNAANSPAEFDFAMVIQDENGTNLYTTSLPVTIQPGQTYSTTFNTSPLPPAYVGKRLTAIFYCWASQSDHTEVSTPVSQQFTSGVQGTFS